MMLVNFIRLAVAIVALYILMGSTGCQAKDRRPNRYLLPDGYIGWVRVNYRIQDAPALPIEDGYYLLRIPMNGLLDTSSNGEEGAAIDEYYYYLGENRRPLQHRTDNPLIWGAVGFGSKSNEPSRYEEFFVGTKDQYEQIGIKCKDGDLNPIAGPVEKCPK